MKKIILISALLICSAIVNAETTVTRDLPSSAAVGDSVNVTLSMVVTGDAEAAVGVREILPEGWNVSDISLGGAQIDSRGGKTSDNSSCELPGNYLPCEITGLAEVVDYITLWSQGSGELAEVIDLINAWSSLEDSEEVIEWLFWSMQNAIQTQDITYTAQISEGASGTYAFSGTYYDGNDNVSTGGDGSISIGDFDISVERTLPSMAATNSEFEITLSVNFNEESLPDSAIITENVPSGFTVSSVSMNGTYSAETNSILWLFGDGENPLADANLSYTVTAPQDEGEYTFSGNSNATKSNVTLEGETGGDTLLNVSLYYSLTITRDLPDSETAGNNLTVTLVVDVNESDLPDALGISESVPDGWTMLDSDCSGLYFSEENKVEFLLSSFSLCGVEDQNISYVLQIPGDAIGNYTLSGTVDYGGYVNPAVSGDSQVTISLLVGDLNGDGTVDIGEVIDTITLWTQEQVTLSEVIEAINNWAAQAG